MNANSGIAFPLQLQVLKFVLYLQKFVFLSDQNFKDIIMILIVLGSNSMRRLFGSERAAVLPADPAFPRRGHH